MAMGSALPASAAIYDNIRDRLLQRKENVQERAEDRRENIQDRRENLQERRGVATSTRAEVRERLAERRKEFIRAFFHRMGQRFDAAIERMRKLGERIQSRIDKAAANGRDVTNAQAALDGARAHWQEARDSLAAARGRLESALSADDPKAAFQEVRELVAESRDQLKAVHAAFVDAITALKGLGRGAGGGTATTTP